MKVNTFRKYTFTAQAFSFTTLGSPDGQDRVYHYERDITLHATTTGMGRLFIFLRPEDDDIHLGYRLEVFKDSDGNDISEGGIFEITQIEPQLNIWGKREGFKGRCELKGATQ